MTLLSSEYAHSTLIYVCECETDISRQAAVHAVIDSSCDPIQARIHVHFVESTVGNETDQTVAFDSIELATARAMNFCMMS